MTQTFDMILRNGTVHTPGGAEQVDVGVRGGKIAAIGAGLGANMAAAGEVIDCTGLDVLPGCIDSQVHFREPGLEHKEDLESGSRAAVMGGVTAVFEMPNTNPNTDTAERIQDKLTRAHHRMWCDHAFYVGATADNAEQLRELERIPGTAGVKIFMGASTGSLLVDDDDALSRVLASGTRRVAIQAEAAQALHLAVTETVVVQDALGSTGGTRAVNDVERMVERDLRRCGVGAGLAQPFCQGVQGAVMVGVQADASLGVHVLQFAIHAVEQRTIFLRHEQEAGGAIVHHQRQTVVAGHTR